MMNDRLQPKISSLSDSKSGFSMVELIIVMLVFIIVIVISSAAFEKILGTSVQLTKSAESNIEGVVGLEILRADLERAGFGLPYVMPFVAEFEESQVAVDFLAKGIDPADFNDANLSTTVDSNKVPRLIQSAAAVSTTPGAAGAWEVGRDYIVLKGTSLGMNAAASKWSYVEGSGSTSTIKIWGTNDLAAGERVTTVDASTRTLIGAGTSAFSYQVAASGSSLMPTTAYQPPNTATNYLVYGVSSDVDLRVPYNRADYYIKRPTDISPRCAKGTGTLYKAVLSHNGGGVTQFPLFDCVADMQVVYAMDQNPDDTVGVDLYGEQNALASLSAETIRSQLKEIRVYILSHEGQKDNSYTHPTSIIRVGETLNGIARGRDYDLAQLDGIGSDWAKYRWKLYKIVVKPRNM